MNLFNKNTDYIFYVIFVSIAVTVFVLYPFAVIWALNYLFNLKINYSLWSWLGIIILHIFFQGNAIFSVKKQ
jgi:hypothetical protein